MVFWLVGSAVFWSFREPLGQTKVMHSRRREITWNLLFSSWIVQGLLITYMHTQHAYLFLIVMDFFPHNYTQSNISFFQVWVETQDNLQSNSDALIQFTGTLISSIHWWQNEFNSMLFEIKERQWILCKCFILFTNLLLLIGLGCYKLGSEKAWY